MSAQASPEDERLHEIAMVLAWADGQELDDVRGRAAYWQGCLMSAAECITDLEAVNPRLTEWWDRDRAASPRHG